MSNAEVEQTVKPVRWAATDGKPGCPECGGLDAYDARPCKGAPRYRCKQCEADFSIASGTLFSCYKLPPRLCLATIAGLLQ